MYGTKIKLFVELLYVDRYKRVKANNDLYIHSYMFDLKTTKNSQNLKFYVFSSSLTITQSSVLPLDEVLEPEKKLNILKKNTQQFRHSILPPSKT